MFLLRRPSNSTIESFLASQEQQPFSYPEVGATVAAPPAGYNLDQNRVLLGSGEESFTKAVIALKSWRMFELGWCRVYPSNAPISVGTVVAIVVKHFGIWSLNACRIVYVMEEQGPVQKYGFAYGTLPEHCEIGEERFSVEWNRDDETVWYELFAFSYPGQLMAKVGYPLSRALQKRFAKESKMAMVRAVNNGAVARP